jgi:hypothetical protein
MHFKKNHLAKKLTAANGGPKISPAADWEHIALVAANQEAREHDPDHVAIPPYLWNLLLTHCDYECPSCERHISQIATEDKETVPLLVDRVRPLRDGGCSCICNLQPLCPSCSDDKARDGAPIDFLDDSRLIILIRGDERARAVEAYHLGDAGHFEV